MKIVIGSFFVLLYIACIIGWHILGKKADEYTYVMTISSRSSPQYQEAKAKLDKLYPWLPICKWVTLVPLMILVLTLIGLMFSEPSLGGAIFIQAGSARR
jgi:hypothetical protein